MQFRTEKGIWVPAVTIDQMPEINRIAVEQADLGAPKDDGECRPGPSPPPTSPPPGERHFFYPFLMAG